MKKILLSLMMVFALAFSLPTQAQVKLGVTAGMRFNQLSEAKHFNEKTTEGWFLGPKVYITIPVIGLGE